jgi:carbamoyl-phosphate synthase large subunit
MEQEIKPSILIPESGGDAGLSAIKCLRDRYVDLVYSLVPVDADPYSPSMYHPNFSQVPYATDEIEYLQKIWSLIAEHNVKVIMPTSDFDAKVLAAHRMAFLEKGIIPIVSLNEVIDEWEDKLRFYEENPNYVAETTTGYTGTNLPVFAKPRYGVGSRGIEEVYYPSRLKELFSRDDDFVFQPILEGEQYTVDVLCSLDGQPLQAVVRKVHRLKGGADVVAEIVRIPKMEKIAKDMCLKYGVRGAACFEFMYDDRGEPKIIDAQPRLSGGHVMTTQAGLNIPHELILLISGETFKEKPIEYGMKMVRTLEGVHKFD